MRFLKFLFLLFLIILFSASNDSYSQILNRLGIKCGFALTGMSTFNIKPQISDNKLNTHIQDSTSFFNNISFDLALAAEWFNSDVFCLSTELHYMQKGEVLVYYYTPEVKITQNGSYVPAGSLYDRSHYLSLQVLPRVKVTLGLTKDNYYFFGGPVIDYKISSASEYTNNQYIDAAKSWDVGCAVGIGFEIVGTVAIEGKYQYDFTGPYNFVYHNDKIERRYNSLVMSANFIIMDNHKKRK